MPTAIGYIGLNAFNVSAAISVLAFLLVFSVTVYIGRMVRSREEIRRRAFRLDTSAAPAEGPAMATRASGGGSGTRRAISSVANNLIPGDRDSASAMRKDLLHAGFFQASALAWFYLIRVVLAVVLPVLTFIAMKSFDYHPNMTRQLGLLALSCIAGLLLPRFFLSKRRQQLQQQCRYGFPDFMDLMVVCAEAGISMSQAIERVSRELQPTYPYFGTCLQLASLELRAGRQLTEAFEGLSLRLGIEEADNLGSLLKQSEELGTSLSEALRVYSEEMRDKRMALAEEKAHALPAKLSVPLMIFIFPMILLVILLPAYVRVSTMW